METRKVALQLSRLVLQQARVVIEIPAGMTDGELILRGDGEAWGLVPVGLWATTSAHLPPFPGSGGPRPADPSEPADCRMGPVEGGGA